MPALLDFDLKIEDYKVKFLPHDTEIEMQDGDTVIRAALEAGVHVNASCGGEGVCGKCRVLIEDGTVEGESDYGIPPKGTIKPPWNPWQ